MSKKVFDPFVLLLMPDPEPTTVTGGGTGQSTTDPYACDFNDWMTMFASDVNGDETIDETDYQLWFQGMFSDDHDEGQYWWEFYGNSGNLFP